MEEYINSEYLTPLLLSWIVCGWIHMVKNSSEQNYDDVAIYDTILYRSFMGFPPLVIAISLVINIFMVGFISTLCYLGILIITQLINTNLLYRIYRFIFGYEGIGLLIPMIGIIPLLIYLFVSQFQ